jgi:hypothetical protein
MFPLQQKFVQAFRDGVLDLETSKQPKLKKKKTWTFFNSMFYCGTVYTTIGELCAHFFSKTDSFDGNLADCNS